MGSQHVKRVLFEPTYQKNFLLDLMKNKNMSQRKLAKELKISRRTLRNWIYETRLLPSDIFHKCLKINSELEHYKNFVKLEFPDNWGRIKGGKIRGKMKTNLTKSLRVKGFRNANLITVKRRVVGPLGEKMYNYGEKLIAEHLLKCELKYEYEPLISLGKNYAFPDFLVNGVIIERCGYSDWPVYWTRIKNKLKLFKKHKMKFILVVPENRFDIAVRRIKKYIDNVIILKENEMNLLQKSIMGSS